MNILESVRQVGSKVQVLWIALPLAALLPGCPLYLDDGHALACTVNADCPSGQECVGGTCHPITGPVCTTDSDCATGEHCDAMACVPGPRVCVTHGDCDPLFMCDISSCEASSNCTTDADCVGSPAGVGGWCDFRHTCVPHNSGDCRTTADCTSGGICVEGSCQQLPTTCQFQYDCPAGTACVNAECTAVCTSSTDCVAGDECSSSHFCTASVGECTTSAMCASGQHCVGGRCLEDCHGGTACPSSGRETSYCAGDMFCHPSWQPAVACNTNSDCATGRHCLAHVCRTPCPTMMDSECGMIDSTLPYCLLDTASSEYLCNAQMSSTASCRTSADCSSTQDCVNAACQ